MSRDLVVFKGDRGGICIVVNEHAPWSEVIMQLSEKLASGRRFFAGAEVRMRLGRRILREEERLAAVRVVREFGLVLADDPQSGSKQESAASWEAPQTDPNGGEAAMSERSPARARRHRSDLEAVARLHPAAMESGRTIRNGRVRTFAAVPASDSVLEPESTDPTGLGDLNILGRLASDQSGFEQTVLIRRTIRSGQSVEFDGNVVVLGDVNPGAVITCSGDIVVLGTLRGVAHAGASGDLAAAVVALRLQPTQLRIGPVISRAPDGDNAGSNGPEIALVRDGAIQIEAYRP